MNKQFTKLCEYDDLAMASGGRVRTNSSLSCVNMMT